MIRLVVRTLADHFYGRRWVGPRWSKRIERVYLKHGMRHGRN